MSKVIVVGGGPSGMMAALTASKNGHQVTLIERNDELGKKLKLTGGGRCNITNAADMEELFDAVVTNSKFLYSSFIIIISINCFFIISFRIFFHCFSWICWSSIFLNIHNKGIYITFFC